MRNKNILLSCIIKKYVNIDNVDIPCTMLDSQTKRRHCKVQKKLRDNSVFFGCIAIQYQLPFNGRTSLEKTINANICSV